MNGIKMIREKLGLNQQQVAEWLGVSRSLVAHYEREERSLPVNARLQLMRMEVMMANMQYATSSATNKKEMHPVSAQRHANVKAVLQHYAKECAYKVRKMQRALNDMQTAHVQTLQWMDVIERLMIEKNTEKDQVNIRWLQAQHYLALEKLKECDEAAQLQMEVKIAVCGVTGETYARMMNDE